MSVDFEKITQLREKKKLSKAEAARQAGLSASQWHDTESGRFADPRVSTLEKIANVLGCKARDLLK